MEENEILLAKIQREKQARQEAEAILEQKSRELYQANTYLKALATDLTEKEAGTRAILEAAADGILVLNAKSKDIKLFNTAACKLFGYEDLLDFKIEALISMPHTEFMRANGKLQETFAIKKNGEQVPVEMAVSDILSGKDPLIVCSIRDISARKYAEKCAETQYAITRIFSEEIDLSKAMTAILTIICNNFRFAIGECWVPNAEKNQVLLASVYNALGEQAQEFIEASKKMTFSIGVGVLPGKIFQDKKPLWIDDVAKDKNFLRKSYAIVADIHSAYGIPVFHENEIYSVIVFFTREIRSFDDKFIKLLEDFGKQIGLFVERRRAQQRVQDLHHEVIRTARLAGMSEVATCVLHNVGNVLNSVNVSVDVLMEKIAKNNIAKLAEVVAFLQANTKEMVEKKEKRESFVSYLVALQEVLLKEQEEDITEVNLLRKHVQHIQAIIELQQRDSRISGVVESVHLTRIIDDSVAIGVGEGAYIEIIRDYKSDLVFMVDKVRLQQILVNLTRNAKEALMASHVENKKLTVGFELLKKENHTWVAISVSDNGVGISSENLRKIFTFGFTTKEQGHGFGLHISALSAKEMGGGLEVYSEGINLGAKFLLKLPLSPLQSSAWIAT